MTYTTNEPGTDYTKDITDTFMRMNFKPSKVQERLIDNKTGDWAYGDNTEGGRVYHAMYGLDKYIVVSVVSTDPYNLGVQFFDVLKSIRVTPIDVTRPSPSTSIPVTVSTPTIPTPGPSLGLVNGGVYHFKCLGDIEGNRWLDGRTQDGTVGLAPTTTGGYTGTSWQAIKVE
jgi:hypothetical protein